MRLSLQSCPLAIHHFIKCDECRKKCDGYNVEVFGSNNVLISRRCTQKRIRRFSLSESLY